MMQQMMIMIRQLPMLAMMIEDAKSFSEIYLMISLYRFLSTSSNSQKKKGASYLRTN